MVSIMGFSKNGMSHSFIRLFIHSFERGLLIDAPHALLRVFNPLVNYNDTIDDKYTLELICATRSAFWNLAFLFMRNAEAMTVSLVIETLGLL